MGFAEQLPHLIQTYGYWLIAGIVLVESLGVPLPGETVLITAGVYAGTTHGLDIGLVIGAAAAGGVAGDNIGYLVGDKIGYRLLLRFGPRLGIGERKIKLGQYLFRLHGGKVVFFGRFVAVLRMLAAFLAGVNRMPWHRFFLANLAGAVLWASLFGLAAYGLGDAVHRIAGPIGAIMAILALAGLALAGAILRRHEAALEEEAVRALPGPLLPP